MQCTRLNLLTTAFCFWFAVPSAAQSIDFQRDIRPILAGNCFACHGPDSEARAADLRLDISSAALADRDGQPAIVPSDRQRSEVWHRVSTTEADLRMPPPDSNRVLTPEQIELLGRWIDEGANFAEHWAFVPPTKPAIPAVQNMVACAAPLDCFIQAKLEHVGLTPSEPADKHALVRRVHLDLIGMPPTVEAAERFVQDRSPIAYERLVDALLASPEYAERWSRPWLDLARYADTNGYEKDRPRTIWPYRDWVIRAIAADIPFDQFTIKQLAGDMLPGATQDDIIATGFHRNTMLNEEGGIDPLEYRFHAMNDRVATTGLVWMGLTTGCAQCHTHKYDPITHHDYYAMFALLNNADEPELAVSSEPAREREEQLDAQVRAAEDAWLRAQSAGQASVKQDAPSKDLPQVDFITEFNRWRDSATAQARRWSIIQPRNMISSMPLLELQADGSVLASGDITKRDTYRLQFDVAAITAKGEPITAIRLEALPHPSLPSSGPGLAYYEGRRGDFFLSELKVMADDKLVELQTASHSFGKLSIGSGTADAANVLDGDGSTGWSTASAEGQANRLVVNLANPLTPTSTLEIELLFERHFAASLGCFRLAITTDREPATASALNAELEAYLAEHHEPNARVAAVEHELMRIYFQTSDQWRQAYLPIAALRATVPAEVRTLIMKERTKNPRVTHRHHRGEYLQPKEVVAPDIVAAFAPLTQAKPQDRLEFAQWLVSDGNPMVGRVTVDRAWRQFFARGIVDSAGDYGTQSPPPSHPELLDYLASELKEHDWSLKHLHREIVLSASYRRSNHRRGEVMQADPQNKWLAMGPRRRLEAEQIRDSLLAASGRLTREIGGPSVYPPQPASVTALAYGNTAWQASTGGNRYRRSLYTFAKRTAPFAAFTVFDGPTGEACIPRRDASNTPLQSLTLLNDEMYVELGFALADEVMQSNPTASDEQLATSLFRRLLTRPPTAPEQAEMLAFKTRLQLAGVSAEQSWRLLTRALMNLDEVLTTP